MPPELAPTGAGCRLGNHPDTSRSEQFRALEPNAAAGDGAALGCILGSLLAAFAVAGCAVPTPVELYEGPPPSTTERYCSWYGEARDGVLYFGQAPFWSAARSGASGADEPEADLREPGPQWIGRFDLQSRELLESLDVTPEGGARSGVWDVLPHPNGRVYFTTFYELAGSVDPATGEVEHYPELGTGLNELALGPEDSIIATRYGGGSAAPEGSGSLVQFSPGGLLLAEHVLAAPAGFALAPKTAAWDEVGARYWLSTDLVQRDPNAPPAPSEHPAIVLDARGAEIARIGGVELHFVRFGPDGWGVAAFVAEGELRLLRIGPGEARWQLVAGAGELLDPAFPERLDFVQDVSFGSDRRVVVTRWSGRVHVVDARGSRRDVQLPRDDDGGLYYSAALSRDDVCATYCSDVAVVCARLP